MSCTVLLAERKLVRDITFIATPLPKITAVTAVSGLTDETAVDHDGLKSPLAGYRFKRHLKMLGFGDREIELFKADDMTGLVLHEDDFLTGFLADVLALRIAKPHGERIAGLVVKNFYLGHIRSPSLIASVG